MIEFSKEYCQGCGLCVEVCPKKLLVLDETQVNERGHTPISIRDEEACNQCSLCAIICPDCVIELK